MYLVSCNHLGMYYEVQHCIYLIRPVDVTTIGNQKLDGIRVASLAGIKAVCFAKLLHTNKVVTYCRYCPRITVNVTAQSCSLSRGC